jgi:multisubunit Na+/H+ antiporter MnhB subunit
MSNEPPSIVQRFGTRGARVALIGSCAVFMILIGGWAAYAIMAALRAGLALRGILIALGTFLLLLLALRVMSLNWRVTRARDAPPEGSEPTGVWGVGGPSMRVPGSTGVYRTPTADRRYENRDE